jgi:hypothetical protein
MNEYHTACTVLGLTTCTGTTDSPEVFLNNQPDPPIIQNLFCHKNLHVSGMFSAHHQEFSTVHSALVSFMQVLMTASKLPS